MGEKIKLSIFFSLEILMNVINLIIIPKSHQFKEDYLEELYIKNYGYYWRGYYSFFSYLEEDLSSPRKTSIAILVFGLAICFIHFLKIIVLLSHYCKIVSEPVDFCLNIVDIIAVIGVIINWSMAISIIPKLNNIRIDEASIKLTDGIKSRTIGVIVLYSLSYVFLYFQHFLLNIWGKCDCFEKTSTTNYVTPYNINNYNPSRNIIINNNTARSEVIQVRSVNTNNSIIILRSILPAQIYANLKNYIEQGKEKLMALIEFFIDMEFDGLTSDESIIHELADIIWKVARILSDILGDKFAKACLDARTDDHLMLCMHYAFPYIIDYIKFKIEKGIYKKSSNLARTNLIQVLTQVERRIERDEQGNIKVSFRVRRQINQASFMGLLNQ